MSIADKVAVIGVGITTLGDNFELTYQDMLVQAFSDAFADAGITREVTLERVVKAPMVAEALGLFGCCPTTDGAAAVILTSRETAERLGKDYVLIKGRGLRQNVGDFSTQFDPHNNFLGFSASRKVAKDAHKQAGITDPLKQVDFVEVHDCFTVTERVDYEDLGFCAKGEGGRFIAEGVSTLEGELPVNTAGGLKSCGHPVGPLARG